MSSNKYAVIVDAEQKFITGLGQIVGGQMKSGEPFEGMPVPLAQATAAGAD